MKSALRVTDNPNEQNEHFFAQDALREKRPVNVTLKAKKDETIQLR